MEIRELIIKRYGKFSDHTMQFRSGINIIYGGNETGKTTIHSFIRAMLFGLNRGRGRAAKSDEYQLRQPWDSPGAFLGSMRFTEGNRVYRVDRCFDRSTVPLRLVCETKAVESRHPEEDLQALLGGVSEAAFVNSVFIPQAHCKTDETLSQELRSFMLNTDSSRSSDIDVTRTLQTLRKRKKQLEQQKKKEDAVLEEKIAQKLETSDRIHRELEQLRHQAGFYRNQQAGTGQNSGQGRNSGRDADSARESTGRNDGAGANNGMRILLSALFFIAGGLTLAGLFFMEGTTLRIFLGVVTALFWGMALGIFLLLAPPDRKNEEEEAQGEQNNCPEELLNEIRGREEAYRKLQEELELLYQQHVQADTSSYSYLNQSGTGNRSFGTQTLQGTDLELAALTLAIDRICEISDRIYQANGGRLSEIASGILSEITGGRYSRIVMDDTAEIRIHTPSRVLGLNQVSGGTMQQIWFALRMAAGEILCGEAKLPLIFDETFAMYDDRRLEATLRWLKKSGRQVIIFTCQSREREILKRI